MFITKYLSNETVYRFFALIIDLFMILCHEKFLNHNSFQIHKTKISIEGHKTQFEIPGFRLIPYKRSLSLNFLSGFIFATSNFFVLHCIDPCLCVPFKQFKIVFDCKPNCYNSYY